MKCGGRIKITFVAGLILLLIAMGCRQVEPEQVLSSKPKLPPEQLACVKPEEGEPSKVKPSQVKPTQIEPTQPKPPQVEPAQVEPVHGPALAGPNQPEVGLAASFHNKCADILSHYVDERGMVDYDSLRRKRLQLKELLEQFDSLDPDVYNSWSKEDKIAFWINAYNIQMLNIIVRNYPIQSSRWLRLLWPPNSIRHIKGIWTDYKFLVMDEEFTLAQIEQRFFRKQFDDPRVFFALYQGCLSSPSLRNEPYCGEKLYQQLDDQVRRFLSRSDAFRIDRDNHVVYLSAMLKPAWFGKEFVHKYHTDRKFKDKDPVERAVLNFIINYVSPEDVNFLELENYSIEYMKYDWRLNEQ